MDDRFTIYGSFTSSSSYKPMLYLALARHAVLVPHRKSEDTACRRRPDYLAVNRYGQVPALRHRGLTIVQSNVILDYLARATGKFEGAHGAGPLDGRASGCRGRRTPSQHRPGAPLQPLPRGRSRR